MPKLNLSAVLVSICIVAAAAPAAAADLGFRQWGPRVGASDDPDQVLAGVQLNLGEFAENLRFQPSFELGLGDDFTVASLTLPVHYRFRTDPQMTPYAGGGVMLSWIDADRGRRRADDADFDIAPVLVGGLEWPVGNGDVFLELTLAGGDAHDAKLVLGWLLRRR